jgi:hypothetical protein
MSSFPAPFNTSLFAFFFAFFFGVGGGHTIISKRKKKGWDMLAQATVADASSNGKMISALFPSTAKNKKVNQFPISPSCACLHLAALELCGVLPIVSPVILLHGGFLLHSRL